MPAKTQPSNDRAEATVVYLGNRSAVDVVSGTRIPLPGKRCTTVRIPPGTSLLQAAYDVTHSTHGVWQAHSDADRPAWVASTDPALAQMLAAHFRCELRDPQPDEEA
jgi:hypothetical protein